MIINLRKRLSLDTIIDADKIKFGIKYKEKACKNMERIEAFMVKPKNNNLNDIIVLSGTEVGIKYSNIELNKPIEYSYYDKALQKTIFCSYSSYYKFGKYKINCLTHGAGYSLPMNSHNDELKKLHGKMTIREVANFINNCYINRNKTINEFM